MSARLPVVLTMAALAVGLTATPTSAQTTPRADVSVGYSFLRDSVYDANFAKGWQLGGAMQITDAVAIVADVSGGYKTLESILFDVNLSVHTFQAGVRASKAMPRVVPFGEFLIGGARRKVAETLRSTEGTSTGLSIQPAVGVDVPVAARVGVRAQAFYRWIGSRNGYRSTREPGFRLGVVYRFGQ